MQQEMQDQPIVSSRQEQKTAIAIANPTAGSYTQRQSQIEDTMRYLREHGWDIELKLTQAQGDAGKFTHEAVQQGLDVVVAIGGDGTINEVIQELAGSNTALAVLPGGTVNVWARETGISLDIMEAREVLLHGQMCRIDLGKVNERYFLLMATIGFDAEVTHAVEKNPVKRLGVIAYVVWGTCFGFGYRDFHADLKSEGKNKHFHALQLVFGNTQLYAGKIKFTEHAKFDDGKLDVCVVRSTTILGRLGILVDFVLRRPERRQWVYTEMANTIEVRTSKAVAIQVDGDPAEHTTANGSPTVIAVVPDALKVLVPQHLPEALFCAHKTHSLTADKA
ncbi:diacylglycerol/lipid kinase family protein [Dictyobacter arantiisoli]|uniref:Diacylglycerol kinase n=1 Tax=Dictyobacter arantiisoli TaxID=2014874 RepID=A0A5A5TBD3_9CHLR|nr:diacylglycerol kinase family protein [Dictyobacter arantiisoli]GCF08708.1 diacylglycerol kinase [Dictyobacter arantiisoli]